MKITAAEIKRPTTNLVSEAKYDLSKEALKTSFMCIFNKVYPDKAFQTLLRVALAPLMDTTSIYTGKPAAAKSQEERQERKAIQKTYRAWDEQRGKQELHQYTSLRKVGGADPHFVVSIPLLKITGVADLEYQLRLFTPIPMGQDSRDLLMPKLTAELTNHAFPAKDVIPKIRGLPQQFMLALQQCLIQVRYQSAGGGAVLFLDLKVDQLQAEYLVSKDWLEIRPLDLYPMFTAWVEAAYVSTKYGKRSFPLSKIAQTLPAHNPEDARVDTFGIAISMEGEPLFIPEVCQRTDEYEGLFNNAGAQMDGSFCLRRMENGGRAPALPVNKPILTDWINNKFTYSNSVGRPVVLSLEHFRKCNASMAIHIVNRYVDDKFLTQAMKYANLVSISSQAKAYSALTSEETKQLSDEDQRFYWDYVSQDILMYSNMVIHRIVASDAKFVLRYRDLTSEGNILFLPIIKFLRALQDAILKNLDSTYVQYAVWTVTQFMGILTVVVKYGEELGTTLADSHTINRKAEEQGVDPGWTPPAVPLIGSRFSEENSGLLPHQSKVRNLVRESPDFAILSVAAGGGKSLLAITDVLYEIKNGSSGPFLILCPAHLVANYVSEIVEFTDGKLNVLPITNFNTNTTGLARYTAIAKDAPVNTVFVVDFQYALKFKSRTSVYGTTSIQTYPVVDFLRQFKPAYVFVDESHYLKDAKSQRTKAVLSLIADIPKKRLASGTLNPDSPSDFPSQVALMDPTLFGTRESFNNRFGATIKGSRVTTWKKSGPDAISQAMRELKGSVVWAEAKRKEWAYALPPREDRFYAVDLTPNQKVMYDAIFDEMVQQLKNDQSKHGKKLFDVLTGKKASKKDESDFGDLSTEDTGPETEEVVEGENPADDSDDIGPALQPYLADIERFVTNPAGHPYSKNGLRLRDGTYVPPLSGDDLKSPKIIQIEKLLREHFADPENAKALVFTNYSDSADAIYDAMPKDLQACGIRYRAAQKTELVHRFKTDPKIKWMVGIRTSLEVGLNLQAANRLIRCENCWNPGQQEQGDSRISRPFFGRGGVKDTRKKLYFDTVIADLTYDITKAARLRAKQVALAKWENPDNPRFENIPDIPVISMTLDNIRSANDFNTNLAAYRDSMAALSQAIVEENEEWSAKVEAEGGASWTPLEQAPIPPGAALLRRVPYALGTELYGPKDLGLTRLDNFLGIEQAEEEESDEDESDVEVDESEEKRAAAAAQRALVLGKPCHTEFGEGVVVGAAATGKTSNVTRIHVRLNDGSLVRGLHATNVFVITRTMTNGIDMRNMLAVAAGLKETAEITVPGPTQVAPKFTKRDQRDEEKRKKQEENERRTKEKVDRNKPKMSVGLQLSLVNGYMKLTYLPGKDKKAAQVMQAQGFRNDPLYFYTRIRTYKHLIAQAQAWAEAGFKYDSKTDNEAFTLLVNELYSGALRSHRNYAKLTTNAAFKNFLRMTWKPLADKKILQFFALVTDGGDKDPLAVKQAQRAGTNPSYGIAYLCLPLNLNSSKLAVNSRYKAAGTRWLRSDPSMSIFVSNLNGVHRVIKDLMEAGIQINNAKELNRDARSVKRITPKKDQTVDLDIDEEPTITKPGRK